MQNPTCVADKTSHGGVVKTGSVHISLTWRATAREPHKVCRPFCSDNEIEEGDPRIIDGDLPLAFQGDRARCGATLICSDGMAASN